MIRLLCVAAIFTALATGPSLSATEATSPVRHAIEAQLDPQSGRLVVVDTVTLRGRAEMRFQLASWLEIDRMLIDGRPIKVTGAAGAWRAPLPDMGEHRVELRLSGMLPPLPPEGVRDALQLAASGPEGSYLPGYASWIPATGDDWIAYRLSVEVPAPYRAVATGRLEEEVVGETMSRAVFAADYPAEPPSLFAGPYEVQERREGGIRIRTYFHPELSGLAADYLRDAGTYLVLFSEQIGPYPFRDFHIISAPVPVGLGFPNLTYIGRTILPLAFIRGRSLAHETLHNWWGNGVAVDYASGNWSEGLTTYMADYALEAEKGAERAREMRLGWLRDYAALPAERDVPVTAFTTKLHEAGQVIGYNKVAFIFHMLRQELAEAVFAKGLRLFWQRQRFRVAGWEKLRQAFEEVSGRDLAWFFEQWLERVGAPRLSLGAVETWTEADTYRLRLTVRQDSPAYRLTVPVSIETRAGYEREQVVLQGVETQVTLMLGAQPLAVHLDPDHDLFRRLLPAEAPPILRDVTLAANAVTVIAVEDAAVERLARQLAERLLDTPVRIGSADPSELEAAPLLIVGTTPDVETFLARAGMDGVPDILAGRGTSRVWTARQDNDLPLLAVAADDIQALEALLRPLPHYGGKSYLVFEGRSAVDVGTWLVADSPLSRRLVR
jgi:hypothetical protein